MKRIKYFVSQFSPKMTFLMIIFVIKTLYETHAKILFFFVKNSMLGIKNRFKNRFYSKINVDYEYRY